MIKKVIDGFSTLTDEEEDIVYTNAYLKLLRIDDKADTEEYSLHLADLKNLLIDYFNNNRTGLLKQTIDNISKANIQAISILIEYVITKNDFFLVQYELDFSHK